jgi:OOP family OmpA-OmpF porin
VPSGTDLTFGVALGLRLADGDINIGPEVYGSTVISDSGDGWLARASTPLEGVFGAKFRVGDSIRLGTAAGTGLTEGLGSPRVRVLASLEWLASLSADAPRGVPARVLSDLDGDGVRDEWDACPTEVGLERAHDPEHNGCPDALDTDGDRIPDEVDACPTRSGLVSPDAVHNGCPPADADEDGITDELDACPVEAGVANADRARNGCPAQDSDLDGIIDAVDSCPLSAGTGQPDPSRNGCPEDSDHDTIPDPVDACPDVPGAVSADPNLSGCPRTQGRP